MASFFQSKPLSSTDHLRLLRQLLIATNCTSLLIFSFIRSLSSGFTFSILEEWRTAAMLMLTGSLIAAALCGAIYALEWLDGRGRVLWFRFASGRGNLLIVLLVACCLLACQFNGVKGISKDLSTGMVTTYSGLAPEESFLVMNSEKLGHTDIPLGETFAIINDGISGLRERSGEVSVGCSLLITDEKGKVMLESKDLFEKIPPFHVDSLKRLRCIVSTGKPMNRDAVYRVKATFWDKFGKGTLTNELSIKTIDIR